MYLIRCATVADLAGLEKLAASLNSMNLPCDRLLLQKLIRRSVYGKSLVLFVMENTQSGRIVGTSQLSVHRHGGIVFDVIKNKAGKRCYRLRRDLRPYTEVGGLVLKKSCRGHPLKLGRQLSYVRFLYLKACPQPFPKRVLAELLPDLPRGQSRLWNYYGKRRTGLEYHEADQRSTWDKRFILTSFPREDLEHDALPPDVQVDMGHTGPQSLPAQHLLEQIGFRYAEQVDPLDGGPYFEVYQEKISLYRNTRVEVYGGCAKFNGGRHHLILSLHSKQARAVCVPIWRSKGRIYSLYDLTKILSVRPGEILYTYPWR